MSELPRSARLAAWGNAVLAGSAGPDDLRTAVTGDDEPHRIRRAGSGPARNGPARLTELLTELRADGLVRFRVVLPAPGDVLGLPGPADFNRAALGAGEGVVAEVRPGLRPWGLLPEITRFGSVWEPGAEVTWVVFEVGDRPDPSGSLAEAERALREATVEAGDVFAGLDRPVHAAEAASAAARLRAGGTPAGSPLPPGSLPRSVRVLDEATRIRLVVAAAERHGGQALDGFAAARGAAALRRLDSAARRAIAAAVNAAAALPDPAGG
jgi:hypothetical protein